MNNIITQTTIPLVLLIGTGLFSRKLGILRSGDERVLSAYLYYFALPALLFVNTVETTFTQETLRYMVAGIVPVLLALAIYLVLYTIFRFTKNSLYLLILSTIFGSTAFFGIPFIMFAFPTRQAEHLAILAVSFIGIVSVVISITVLELYKIGRTTIGRGLKRVAKRLSKNPLVISIVTGLLLAIAGVKIPHPLSIPIHMLGSTTATVAIFMLGVFLYGRKYTHIIYALKLSLMRIIFLPILALLTVRVMDLPDLERIIIVLMHSMPVAISMIIMSQRYNFYEETVTSLILVSSIGAGLYLNIWLFVLGYH